MSSPTPAKEKLLAPQGVGEALRRFGAWCAANPVQAALLFASLGTLIWFYVGYQPLANGHSFWRWTHEAFGEENDLEHGPLILPGAIIVAWLHREDFARAVKQPSWLGLLPLIVGILFFIVAVWTVQARLAQVAFPLLLLGAIWFVWGLPTTRVAFLPCVLLLFMVPVGFLLSHTEPLQRFVASIVGMMSNLIGVGVERDGVKLLARDGSFQCEVAGGCSGIRSIIAMTMLSLLYVHFNLRETWQKLLVFAMTLPFAVLGNTFRVFTIVLVSKWFGQETGTGPWHDISGFIITIPIAVGAMIWFGDLLTRDWSDVKAKLLARDEPAPQPAAAASSEPKETKPAPPGGISYDY
jgi:exosortase